MDTPRPGFRPGQNEVVKRQSGSGVCALWVYMALVLAGCGAPGEPVPPTPPLPVTITDLSAQQAGDAVMLNFTMPTKSVVGDKLPEVPTMEILRGSLSADGTPDAKTFHVVDTVPGAMIKSYLEKGRVHFVDPVAPAEIRSLAGTTVIYRVRARVSDKKTSAPSNDASLKLFVVAAAIENLRANLTEHGTELAWAPPEQTSGGETIAAIEQYHVYRGELDPSSSEAAARDMGHAVWKSPLVQIATTKIPEYRDSAFDYGKTYVYRVRSSLAGGGASAALESNDSNSVVLTPLDTFPPAAPQGVVAAVLPGAETGQAVVDLSWSISVEADLAGYRVYRSEKQGERGKLLTAEVLLTPAYRDNSVTVGQHYWYGVSAVDRAGNESALSEPVSVDVSQP